METLQCIAERRSIRHFTNTDIDNEQLWQLMDAARMAPSWANTQCWKFIIVRNPATREELVKTIPEGNPARKTAINAPVLLVACGQLGKSGFYKGKAVTNKDDNWYLYDVGLATQNISLAAHDLGLGLVILGLFDAEKAGEILGLPEDIKVVTMMPLGVPAKTGKMPPRKPLCEFVFRDRYEKAWVSGEEGNLSFVEE